MIMSYCHHYHLRRSTQWNHFNDVYLLSKFCFQFLRDWRYRDFKLVISLNLSISKLIFILFTLGKSKLSLFVLFYYCGQVAVTLLSLGKTYHEKQFKLSPFDKNSRTTINDSISRNQELVSSVTKQALYVQSFISFCNTFFLIFTIE